jgi:uncharacterized membrane protein YbjE (DUF340 family)
VIEAAIKQHWQQTQLESTPMNVGQLQLKATQFQRQARTGDRVEYFGCALVAFSFGSFLWAFPDPLLRLGSLTMISATLFAGFQLRKHKAASLPPVADIASSLLEFHRMQLVRRRQLLEGSCRVVIGPLLLGLLVFTACLAARDRSHQAAPFVLCGITVVLGVVLAIYNRWRAKQLQLDIDALDAFAAKH